MNKESYITIARRFRPQNFSQVLGQAALKETLKNALINNTLASAYIFSGTRGTGKTTLARIFAKAINCQNKSMQFEPCNDCTSCKEISNSSSFEVIEIDGASNRGIDDIRNIHENIGLQTRSNVSKIYIIDEVHMLTKEAFNALLKTLEEPASNTRFFFATTELHKIPSTILSRCQKFELLRIDSELICTKLKTIAKELNISADEDAYQMIAKLSQGSLRDAESLFDQMICFSPEHVSAESIFQALGLVKLDLFKKLDQAYKQAVPAEAFSLAQEFFRSGIDNSLCLHQIIEHFRNITLFKTSQQHLLIIKTQEMIDTYTKASQIYTKEALYYLLDYLTNMQTKLSSQNFGLLELEMLFLHILQTSKRMGIDTIIEKIEALSENLEKKEAPTNTATNQPTVSSNQAQKLPNQEQLTKTTNSTIAAAGVKPTAVKIDTANEGQTAPFNPTATHTSGTSVPSSSVPSSSVPSDSEPEPLEDNKQVDEAVIARDETRLQFASVELSARLKKY